MIVKRNNLLTIYYILNANNFIYNKHFNINKINNNKLRVI